MHSERLPVVQAALAGAADAASLAVAVGCLPAFVSPRAPEATSSSAALARSAIGASARARRTRVMAK
jgi:hypothetical protein